MLNFADLLASPSATRPGAGRAGRAPASSTTRSTSSSPAGTTGNPKGATLSHHNILNNGFFVGEAIRRCRRGDRLCIPVPLYHCFGMVMGNLGCLTHGATMVFPAGFEPRPRLATVGRPKRCTALYGVPTMFIAESATRIRGSSTCPRCAPASWPGSPCPVEVMKRVVDRMNMAR